jgi:hypothetical protein
MKRLTSGLNFLEFSKFLLNFLQVNSWDRQI